MDLAVERALRDTIMDWVRERAEVNGGASEDEPGAPTTTYTCPRRGRGSRPVPSDRRDGGLREQWPLPPAVRGGGTPLGAAELLE